MKLATRLALSAALASAFVSAPVFAKDPPAAAAPAMKLGNPFRAAAGPLQAAIKAKNAAEATAKLAALEAVSTGPDEKFVLGQLMLQVSQLTNDKALQVKSVETMVNSGSTLAAAELPKLNFYAGNFAYNAGDMAKALSYLQAAERGGFTDNGNVYLLLAETNFKTNQVPTGLAYVDKAIAAQKAAGQKPPEGWYARAASMAYKSKLMTEAAKWTREQVRAYPTLENWRSALVIYRDGDPKREGQQNLDIFRLMRATKSLAGERDYYEFASLAADRGLPGEARAVIDEGLASNAIPAGSRAINDLRALVTGKLAGDQASLATSERQAGTAANGRLAANTADAYLGYGQDAKALALYKTALAKGGADVDAVNLRMGIAMLRTGDKAGARQAFQAVKGPRAETAGFWLLWLDQQG